MLNCKNCGKELKKHQIKFCSISCENSFKKKKNEEDYNLSPNKCKVCGKILPYTKKDNAFCSHSCAAKFNNKNRTVSEQQKSKTKNTLKNYYKSLIKTKKERKCIVCGKEYYKSLTPSSTLKMCSKECSEFYKANRKLFLSDESLEKLSKGGRKSVDVQGEKRRSKNEIYFYELCKKHFKNVEHNKRMFNGWDADVIIEDIKYAIMWNGVWHYKEIYENSLKKVQNRDALKIEEIKKLGYTAYIIKDMGGENKKFVENEFDKFLKHIAK